MSGSRSRGGGGVAAALRHAAQESFGLPAVVAVIAGLLAGFGLPVLDEALDLQLPVIEFATEDAARSLLGTIASATLTVAALSFSVTLTAFTLSASQLSPRVLRTFAQDGLSKGTLAALLGTSIYCLGVLVQLGASVRDGTTPNLSITLAVLLAVVSFLLFAVFIAHIVRMLQPAAIIDGIAADARSVVDAGFPDGIGQDAGADEQRRCAALAGSGPGGPVRARDSGYLVRLAGDKLLAVARDANVLVRQHVAVGDHVVAGDLLAETWPADGPSALEDRVRAAFVLGNQRTALQDLAFPVRQLADIALKGLSPGINDPTTAENAMNAMTAVIVRLAAAETVSPVRADEDGCARLIARPFDLDAIVRLGFEDVRVFASPYPTLSVRLIEQLQRIDRAAREHARTAAEPRRQAELLRQAVEGEQHVAADRARVARALAGGAATDGDADPP